MARQRQVDIPKKGTAGTSGSISGNIHNGNFDVVIVGAGPAGLECARVLQASDLSVLIIDKNEHIGPKPCAGGIVDTVEPLDLPQSKARTFNAVTVFLGGRQYEFTTRLSLKIIDREDLGHHQTALLKGAGNVSIKTGTAALKIGNDRVITTDGEFRYRFLVGADGSTSMVRRYLNIDSTYMVGIYYDIDEPKDRMIFRLDGKVYKTGYIWEFPHRRFTNVGFFYNPVHWPSRDAVGILRHYMRQMGYPMNSRTYRAFPINYRYRGIRFGENIFLAGDAAGLASKLTGEGIAQAMVSGREIAKKILDSHYETPKLRQVVANKKRQDVLANFLGKLPFGFNSILRIHIKALKARLLRWPT